MNAYRQSFRNRRGITLTDLCAVLAGLLLLVAVVPAIRQHATEESNRAKCADNLTQLFAAMQTYANANNQSLPRTYFDRLSPKLTAYTGINDPNSFGPNGPAANDVTGSIYLLIKATGSDPKLLICPGSEAVPYDEKVAGKFREHSNFPSRLYLSYSMQNPFPSKGMVITNWQWNLSQLSTGDPLFSDMNPGSDELKTLAPSASTAEMRPGNSRNHGGDGQNVLYGDKHVDFVSTPFCGPKHGDDQDNIFTSNSTPPGLGVQGEDKDDAVMLPLATMGVQPPTRTAAVSPAAQAAPATSPSNPPAPSADSRERLKKALEAVPSADEPAFSTQRIVLIALGVVLLGALVAFFFVRRRKQ